MTTSDLRPSWMGARPRPRARSDLATPPSSAFQGTSDLEAAKRYGIPLHRRRPRIHAPATPSATPSEAPQVAKLGANFDPWTPTTRQGVINAVEAARRRRAWALCADSGIACRRVSARTLRARWHRITVTCDLDGTRSPPWVRPRETPA